MINTIDAFVYEQLILFLNSHLIKNKSIKSLVNDSSKFLKYKSQILFTIKQAIHMAQNNLFKIVSDSASKQFKFVFNLIKNYLVMYWFSFVIFYFKKSKREFINSINMLFASEDASGADDADGADGESSIDASIKPTPQIVSNIIELFDEICMIKLYIKSPSKANASNIKPFLEHIAENESNYLGTSISCMHNIISFMIFNEIYMKKERHEVLEISELINETNANFEEIYIVVQNKRSVDYNSLEVLLKDTMQNVDIEEYFDLLNETQYKSNDLSIQEKVRYLFDHKIIVPIIHDFLRFHKDDEVHMDAKYMPNKKDKTSTFESTTKIRKILNNIERIVNHNFHGEGNGKAIEKYFPQQFEYKYGTVMNMFEELKVLSKIEKMGGRTALDSDQYNDLVKYRKYAYITFINAFKSSFDIRVTRTIDVMRYCNIINTTEKKIVPDPFLQTRTCNIPCSIGGIAFINPFKPIECCPYDSVHPIPFNSKSKKSHFGSVQKLMYKHCKQLLTQNKHYQQHYWMFDESLDKLPNNTSNVNNTLTIKTMLASLYDIMASFTLSAIFNKFMQGPKDLYSLFKIIDQMQSRFVNVNKVHLNKRIKTLIQQGHLTGNIPSEIQEDYDVMHYLKNKVTIPSAKVFLRQQKIVHIPYRASQSLSKTSQSKEKLHENTSIAPSTNSRFVCQHIYDLSKIKTKNMSALDSQQIYQFYKKYMTTSFNGHICKSCGELLDIKWVNIETIHQGNDDVVISNILTTPLETIKEYKPFWIAIVNINKIIEIVANRSNFTDFYTNINFSIEARRTVTKKVIDLINAQNAIVGEDRQALRKEFITFADKHLGLSRSLYFIFGITNDIFKFAKNQEDSLKDIKYNNIVCHVIMCLLTELSTTQILNINMDKKKNLILFEKLGMKVFSGMYIYINDKNDATLISNYKLLCFVIFHMCSSCVDYNIARLMKTQSKHSLLNLYFNENLRNLVTTVVTTLNRIIMLNHDPNQNKNYLFNEITIKFFSKLSMYKSKHIYKHLINQCSKLLNITTQNKIEFIKKTTVPSIRLVYSPFEPIPVKGKKYNNTLFLKTIDSREERSFLFNSDPDVVDSLLCTNVHFRNWVYINHELIDILSNKSFTSLLKSQHTFSRNDYIMSVKRRIANHYCVQGGKHELNYDTKTCNKCGKHFNINIMSVIHDNLRKSTGIKKDIGYMQFSDHYMQEYTFLDFSDAEIEKVYQVYTTNIHNRQKILQNKIKLHHDKLIKHESFVKKYNAGMGVLRQQIKGNGNKTSTLQYVDKFIDAIQNSKMNNSKFNMINDTVVLNSNIMGYKIDSIELPFKKLFNTTFKRTVYSILHKKTVLYFDFQFKHYLGYQEKNKPVVVYTDILKTHSENNVYKPLNIFLKPIYSFKSMINYIGYSGDYIPVSLDTLEQDIVEISLNRIKYLQNFMNKFKLLLFSINFKHNNPDPLVMKYKSKIDFVNIDCDGDGNVDGKDINHKLFDSWKQTMYLQVDNVEQFDKWKSQISLIDSKVAVDDIISLTTIDTVPHYCIIKEINRLIRNNKNPYTRFMLFSLFYEFVKREFKQSFNHSINESVIRFNSKLKFLSFNADEHTIEQSTITMNDDNGGIDGIDNDDAIHNNIDISSEEGLDIEGIDIFGNIYTEEFDEYDTNDTTDDT